MRRVLSNLSLGFILIGVASLSAAIAADTAKVHRTGIGSPNAFIFVAGADKGFYKDNGIDALTIMAQPQVGVQGLIGGSFDFSQILGHQRQDSPSGLAAQCDRATNDGHYARCRTKDRDGLR